MRRRHPAPQLHRLDERIAPSVANGDFYWADSRQVPLTERTGQVAVRFQSEPDAASLAGYDVVKSLDSTVMFVTAGPSPRPKIEEATPIAERPGVIFAAPVFENPASGGYVVATNEIIVRLRDGVMADEFFAVDQRLTDPRRLEGTPDTYFATLTSGSGRDSLALANSLMSDPRLVWASPNLMIESHLYTVDPLYINQWHLNNTGQSGGSADADVDAPEAWQITTGSPNIVIAVIDDAIQRTHPDLAPNVWVNPGEISGNSIDDDGNGWADDVSGWDFWDNDSNPTPATGTSDHHGTATSGVAVSAGNNNLGGAGIAYGSKLLPIRSNIVPALSPNDVPTAVYYAAGRTASGTGTWRGADILSCSWGFDAPLQTLSDAFAWASANGRGGRGLPTFIASGNGGNNAVGYPAYLAGSLSGVMAVGGSTHTDVRVSYSQYGPELDFLTPTRAGSSQGSGGGITTTDRTGTAGYSSGDYYSNFSGTSSATPLAAGIGALALSRNGNLTAAQLRGLLRNTTDLIGPQAYSAATGKNNEYGFGRLNANTAVRGVDIREIQVLDGNTDVPNGSTEGGFAAAIGASQTRTFRIRNQGTLDLTLGSLTLPAGPFSISTPVTDSVLSVGEATTFTVQFAPTAGGTSNVDLTITTDDADEGNLTIRLEGAAPVPPQVESIEVNGGAVQRSQVTGVTVAFDRVVTLPGAPVNAFSLTGPGGPVAMTANVATATGVTIVTLSFTGLADGNYEFRVLGGQVSAGGVALDGDGDLVPGGDAVHALHRYYGDADGNRRIDVADFGVFSTTYNRTSADAGFVPYFDFNADDRIDISDFGQFSIRYFTTLP